MKSIIIPVAMLLAVQLCSAKWHPPKSSLVANIDKIPDRERCAMSRKPKHPEPKEAENEFFVTDCTEGSLAKAIEDMGAVVNATLFLDCGPRPRTIFVRKTLVLPKFGNFRIVGRKSQVTLDGRGSTQLINVHSRARLEVYNVAFRRGMAVNGDKGGGAIKGGWRTILKIVDCEFSGNRAIHTKAIGGGGAIYSAGGGTFVWNSIFTDNRGTTGGAIQVTGGNMRIQNCIFTRNFATGGRDGRNVVTGHGGALRCDRPNNEEPMPVRICGSLFEGNGIMTGGIGRNLGGAVEIWGHGDHLPKSRQLAQIRRTRFIGNGRSGEAPHIVVIHGEGDVSIRNVDFTDNRCTRYTLRIGSPKFSRGYTTTMAFVTFKNNEDIRGHMLVDPMKCNLMEVNSDDGEDLHC